jgi:hypothetical protein
MEPVGAIALVWNADRRRPDATSLVLIPHDEPTHGHGVAG